ncbi:phosphatidate cytidylyltransferase [Amorphus sp. 3PC139-8]|uniref:phosphatidate cytidylyltransferase n=1 Tax=Amorphus sp. 3PC139-8 TaxID=2735676 RepID=UPI00345D9A12
MSRPSRNGPHIDADLIRRVVSSAVLAPAALLLAWAGDGYFAFGLVLLGLVVMVEWFRMIAVPWRSIAFLVAVGALAGAALVTFFRDVASAVALLLAGVAMTGLAVTTVTAAGRPRRGVRAWTAGGLAYAGFGVVAFMALRQGERGFLVVLLLFAVGWATDILAFFVGRTFGGPKLWPSVSPKKTWSGAIGGLAAGGVAGWLLMWAAGVSVSTLGVAVFLALSIVAQLGDLLESGAKRRFGLKDSGRLIPGHGGLMDRVDGILAAGVLALIVGVAANAPGGPSAGFFSVIGAGG